MNYYPFHLGDYAAHTAHLEPMEDLAYRRMLDLYYRTERPLPSDWREVARLIRLKDCGQEIESVLAEFFELRADGWHNKRADEEIASMHAKQEHQASKDEHEAERMRRHRERRAALFADLREVGVIPAWDVGMKELLQLHAKHCNGPEMDLKREQAVSANAPATAIPTPTPITKEYPPTPQGGRFAEFWEAWPKHPRKAAKPQCERKWRTKGCDAMADQILAALRQQRGSHDWTRNGGEFIPAPLVWLNQARWEAPAETTADTRAVDAVAETKAMLDRQSAKLSDEEKARADEARAKAMQAIRRVV